MVVIERYSLQSLIFFFLERERKAAPFLDVLVFRRYLWGQEHLCLHWPEFVQLRAWMLVIQAAPHVLDLCA